MNTRDDTSIIYEHEWSDDMTPLWEIIPIEYNVIVRGIISHTTAKSSINRVMAYTHMPKLLEYVDINKHLWIPLWGKLLLLNPSRYPTFLVPLEFGFARRPGFSVSRDWQACQLYYSLPEIQGQK